MTPNWFTHLPNATATAWWGALLSTVLALVKGWELWRDRFRIEIDSVFTGAINIGNKIRIRNLSPNPIMISYWEVFYRAGIWPFLKKTFICDMNFDNDGTTIPSHSVYTLTFADEDYFSTSFDNQEGRKIFIRLHIAGGKTVCRKIY
ncbi:hypothetical protein [Dyella choica]|uniref:Uncharacterized protein n=1 Tax=Dyella choica TaxID=1927959 RepID=A0A3S0PHQ1_9GAMM|nr:hypothetical protein [Dyella choica]RUL74079.1 hypothetical protein EKH80_14720 [Dyella choica]